MPRTNKQYPKERKTVYVLILEGRNQTEKLYFNHFITRDAQYALKLIPAEDTDPVRMAKKGMEMWRKHDIRSENGEKVFCLVDVDLSSDKVTQIEIAKKKYPNIEFVLSNPCFETWLLYYFTEHPAVVSSPQKVKDELRKFVPNYTENTDVIAECNLQDYHAVAINRAEKKQMSQVCDSVVNRNPYTEVHNLIVMLIENNRL